MVKGHNRFDIDLAAGNVRDGSIAEVLRRGTVEIKCDFRFSESGNVCVEFEQWGPRGPDGPPVPSGIEVTEADWYLFRFVDDTMLVLPTEKLRGIYERVKLSRARWPITGDHGNRSVLIPIQLLLPCSKMHYSGPLDSGRPEA